MTNALTLALTAGLLATPATALAESTPLYTSESIAAKTVAHIYYNLATGEQIASILDSDFRPASVPPAEAEVWIADNNLPCAAFGQTSGTALVVDAPNGEFGFVTSEANIIGDWADITADTVIDCLTLNYSTGIEGDDANSDGFSDGVEGFALEWIFFEGDFGFGSIGCQGAWSIISFTLTDLPGQLDGPGGFAGYDITVDLGSDFDTSQTFEFGDTDSDQQSAAHYNPMLNADSNSDGYGDLDVDRDGLVDFSYYVSFIQPGRQDTDNADGDNDPLTGIDGDPEKANITALGLAHYRGQTIQIDNGDGTTSYEVIPDAGVNASGADDAFDIFTSSGIHQYTGWMGGFTCDDPDDNTVNAFGQIRLALFGPTDRNPVCSPADIAEPYGINDIFDVVAFIELFNASDPCADFADPAGVFDIFDVLSFVEEFNRGCPL